MNFDFEDDDLFERFTLAISAASLVGLLLYAVIGG
jgi:hypothetical protein